MLLLFCHPLFSHGFSSTMGVVCHGSYHQPVMTHRIELSYGKDILASYAIVSRMAFQGNVKRQRSLREHNGMGGALSLGWRAKRVTLLVEIGAMRLWMRGDGVSLLYSLTLKAQLHLLGNLSLIAPLSWEIQSGIQTCHVALGCKVEIP